MPSNVIGAAFVETVTCSGVTVAGGVDEDSGDSARNETGDDASSGFGLDVGDESPKVIAFEGVG